MKNLKIASFLCGSALALTAGGLTAQQSSQTQPSSPASSSPQSSQQTSPSYGAGSQTQSGQRQSAQPSQGSQGSLGAQSGLGASSSALDASRSSMHSGNSVRLSELMHSSVQSQEGKSLGQIRDLLVDPQSGRIEFAILSLSSAGGAADTSTSGRETVPSSRSSNIGTPSATTSAAGTGKLIPVPWQLFSQSFSRHSIGSAASTSSALGSQNLVLNIDESKLRTAPSFDAGSWNQLQTGSLDQQVYSHFGVDRSSATGTLGGSVTGQGTSESSSGHQQQPYRGSSQQPQSGSSHSTSPQGSSSSPQPQSGSSSQSAPQGSSSSPDR